MIDHHSSRETHARNYWENAKALSAAKRRGRRAAIAACLAEIEDSWIHSDATMGERYARLLDANRPGWRGALLADLREAGWQEFNLAGLHHD